ncbi:3497_t:CDS:10, partial [Acaulospora colombiana]
MTTSKGTFILLPPIPVDVGKARCRVSRVTIDKQKVVEGQWVRLCFGEAVSLNRIAIDVTVIVRFRRVNGKDVEKRQLYDLGFVWKDGSEGVKCQTIRSMLNNMLVCKGFVVSDEKRCLEIEILNASPSDVVLLFTKDTLIDFLDRENHEVDPGNANDIDSVSTSLQAVKLEEGGPKDKEAVPGLEQAYEALYEVVSYPLLYPDLIQRLNIECPKGVLIYGPPGVGKTFLVNEIAKACNAKMVSINGPDVFGTYVGESESRLRDIFSQARSLTVDENCPVILFIDELDALTPHRTEAQSHESRVVAQLLTLMDGMKSRGRFVVIAATNRPNAIDSALRRPGRYYQLFLTWVPSGECCGDVFYFLIVRFDREIAVDVPSEESRCKILKLQTSTMPLDEEVDLALLASITSGYVGADLASFCREAAMNAVHRKLKLIHVDEEESSSTSSIVTMSDFLNAMSRVLPSMQRGFQVNIEKTSWNDIGGLELVKKQIIQAVEWPLKRRDTFKRLGLKSPRGILLYGPPGCSKTTLVKAMASTSGVTFLSVNGAELYSPFVGDSEKIIRSTFRRARSSTPSIIFFDEIDAIVGKRRLGKVSDGGDGVQERVLSTLLNEMDGVEITNNVLVVGATNRPDMLDDALLRPGRFDKLIYVPPPDLPARKHILRIHTLKTPLCEDVDLDVIAEKTEMYTGADLMNLCRESAMISLREANDTIGVNMSNFFSALKVVKPSLNDMMNYGTKKRENTPDNPPENTS